MIRAAPAGATRLPRGRAGRSLDMRLHVLGALLSLALLAAACGRAAAPLPAGGTPVPAGGPSVTPSATPPTYSAADLEYRLFAQVGQPFWCDPDLYPLGRRVADADVRSRVDAMRATDPSAYAAVLRHLSLGADPQTPDQERAVYQELKRLRAVSLAPSGGAWTFDYTIEPGGQAGAATRVQGTISGSGAITVRSRAPAFASCPI